MKDKSFVIDQSKRYQRLFRLKGLLFLIDDIFMGHYKKLDALVTVIKDDYTSYIPKSVFEKSLNEGVSFLRDKNKIKKYEKDFNRNNFILEKHWSKINTLSKLTENELRIFINLLIDLIGIYAKTEYYYTDKAYFLADKREKSLRVNLKKLGEIKNHNRLFLNKVFFGKNGYLNLLLSKLSKQFNVKQKDLLQYGYMELLDLFHNKRVNAREVSSRNTGFIMRSLKGKISVLTGSRAVAEIRRFNGERSASHGRLTGIIANKGVAVGKVRIISSSFDNYDKVSRDMHRMRQGEILVSETTSPDLMAACSKAGAIVTDQGGLMSHAAIVSRELGIPCIVGTHNATRSLKNGDLIKVDANKGLVKIIAN